MKKYNGYEIKEGMSINTDTGYLVVNDEHFGDSWWCSEYEVNEEGNFEYRGEFLLTLSDINRRCSIY